MEAPEHAMHHPWVKLYVQIWSSPVAQMGASRKKSVSAQSMSRVHEAYLGLPAVHGEEGGVKGGNIQQLAKSGWGLMQPCWPSAVVLGHHVLSAHQVGPKLGGAFALWESAAGIAPSSALHYCRRLQVSTAASQGHIGVRRRQDECWDDMPALRHGVHRRRH